MKPELTEALMRELAKTLSMVQVVCITIDGAKVVLLGPVLHVPDAGIHVGNIEEIEFGELVPAHLAAKMLDGGFSESMGVQ
ncbi:hypothetical protein [Limnohabitans sp.]|jgi:hypothetical protein|uniref:hypothetical protein n=1 Tax=Limnohabitans sp. TaxID=1907725 RepID=UPI00333F957D